MSTQEVADAINDYLWQRGINTCIDHRFVSKYEYGVHRWPASHYREAFRHVLGVATDAELGFYGHRRRRSTTDPARDSLPRPQEPMAEPSAFLDFAQAGVGRRPLLAGVAAVAVAAGFLGDGGEQPSHRLGPTDVLRMNAVTDLYRSMDCEWGGDLLYCAVAKFAESATTLLRRGEATGQAGGLASAVALARQLAGWTAFDAGRYFDAQRHFVAAERIAVVADDPLLAARVRYCQARQFQHLRHNEDALQALEVARAHLGNAATPAVNAMLHGAEAASLAALGDRRMALGALDRARDAFERVDPDCEPRWMQFYDRGELLAQYGRVYRDLAREDPRHAESAVRFVTEAIQSFGPQNVRSNVLNQVGLCSAYFLVNDPEHALVVGDRVVQHAQRLTSRRVLDRVRNLRRDLIGHLKKPDVAEFDKRLAEIAPVAV